MTGTGLGADEFGRLVTGTVDEISGDGFASTDLGLDGASLGLAVFQSELGVSSDLFLLFSRLSYEVIGTESSNKIDTAEGDDRLVGAGGNDTLSAGNGRNTLEGGEGNDVFLGGAGEDAFIGGADIDTVSYASRGGGLTIDLAVAGPQNTNSSAFDSFDGIENLIGGYSSDQLRGSSAANRLDGGSGSDGLFGRGGDDVLDGGEAGRDRLFGDAGNDRLFGRDDNDNLAGGQGTDTLIGGYGRDTLIFTLGGGADLVMGFENGVDRLDLRRFGFASFQEVLDRATDTVGGLRIELRGGDLIVMDEFTKARFDSSDVVL